jgi:hypothetical protein
MGEGQSAMGNKMTKSHFSCFIYSLVHISGACACHPHGWSPPQRAKPVEPPLHARSIDLRWRQQSMQPVLFIKDCPCEAY